MRHVVSRSVRDSAALLDVLAGVHDRRPVHRAAAAPSRTRDEVGDRSRPRCASACARPRRAALAETDPVCVAAVDGPRRAAHVARSHRRRVRAGRARRSRASWISSRAVMMSCLRAGPRARSRSSRVGRSPPTTSSRSRGCLRDEQRLRRRRVRRRRRGDAPLDAVAWCRGGPTAASTCCSRRRSRSRRPCSATLRSGRRRAERGGSLRSARGVHAAVQRDRAARDVGAVVLERRRASRSACTSSAAPSARTCLLRVAAQLETARPWADRRPPVHA